MSASEQKRVLRERLRAMPIEDAAQADRAIQAHIRGLLAEKAQTRRLTIGAYWPMSGEVDYRPALLNEQKELTLGLPVVMGNDKPLLYREWQPDQPLTKGRYGIPVPDEAQPLVVPDVLLIPMLGFDRAGYRLGMGGGFYDRTLVTMAALTIGLCYQARMVEALPREAHDQPLDWIVTEEGAMSFASTQKGRG